MPDILDLVAILFSVLDLTERYTFMASDYIGWFALIIFLGGIAFWLMVLAGLALGFCRGVVRLFVSAREVFAARRSAPAE